MDRTMIYDLFSDITIIQLFDEVRNTLYTYTYTYTKYGIQLRIGL